MSEKHFDVNPATGALVKKKGWHSWRHPTNAEQVAAKERYQRDRGPLARRRRALERLGLDAPLVPPVKDGADE